MIRDIKYELLKMCCHKKNLIPLGGYVLFIILCYIAYKTSTHLLTGILTNVNPDSLEAQKYLDGFFFARLALVPTFIVLMPLVMATLGGDCIAGEMQEGSLKLYMSRPRSRTRVILTKFSAIYIAGLLYSLFFAGLGFLIGYVFFGLVPLQILIMPGRVFGSVLSIMTAREALIRYGCITLYFSFSLLTLGAMALFLSTLFNRMTSATLAVVTIYFVSYVVAALPFSDALRPWLISEITNNAFLFWMTPLPWGKLFGNLTVLAMYICGFLFASLISFNYKDIR